MTSRATVRSGLGMEQLEETYVCDNVLILVDFVQKRIQDKTYRIDSLNGGWRRSPAMAFSPAQNHEVKLSISPIHQVPSVPAKHHKSLVHTEKTTETQYVAFY